MKSEFEANSEGEAGFLGKVIISLGQIPIPEVMSADQTQAVAQAISKVFDSAWIHHAKAKRACACSKPWWDTDCDPAKASVMMSDLPANWMAFKKAMRKAKCKHFYECICKGNPHFRRHYCFPTIPAPSAAGSDFPAVRKPQSPTPISAHL
jgi:hypothetical protein